MIEWLNQNQGFAIALLTFVYVIATIFLAYIAFRTARIGSEAKEISKDAKEISSKALEISGKQLSLISELEKQRVRPYVLFNLTNEYHRTYATLKNYGLTSAKEVSLVITPKLERAFDTENDESIISSQVFSLMPPNFEIKDSLGGSPRFYEKYKEAKFEGIVRYKDSSSNEYSEAFSVDLDALRRRLWNKVDSIPNWLNVISKEIELLRKSLENLKDG